MTAAGSKSAPSNTPRYVLGVSIALALVGVALWQQPEARDFILRVHWRLKAPDLTLLARQGLAIKLHLGAALSALAIGTVIMMRPKGVGLHKTLGWSWVAAMAVTAASSFFITGLNGHNLSVIHLLSGWTVIALPMGVAAIRGRKVSAHRRTMTGLYIGGLLLAGALTFIPGRLMWRVFFG